MHDSTVSCFTKALSKGSTFTVELLRLMQDASTDRRQSNRELKITTGMLRFLVVDNNKDAVQILAILLEASGHHVFVEYGSINALERVRIDKPDVCILDIGLPEIDGYQLVHLLRSKDATAAAMIAFTGYGEAQDRQQALEAVLDHHPVKPVDAGKLMPVISNLRGS